MSQEKVDKYKQAKANREKIMKREKRLHLLEKAAVGLVCLAVVVWIGYSGYSAATKKDSSEKVTTEMDVTAVNGYLSSLSGDSE